MCETSNDYNLDKRQLKDSWLLMERRFKSLQISPDCSSRDPLLNFWVSSRHLNNISIFLIFRGEKFRLLLHMPALIVVPIYHRISFINFGECIKNILWHIKNICPVCGHPALHRHCVCCCVVAAAAGGGLAPADGQRWRRRRHPGPSSLQWTPACSTAALPR